jgi:hypothetical protein
MSPPRPLTLDELLQANIKAQSEANLNEPISAKTEQSDLSKKVTSLYQPKDPFRSVYLNEKRGRIGSDGKQKPKSAPSFALSVSHLTDSSTRTNFNVDVPHERSPDRKESKSTTLQRILALRRAQKAIQSAPNPSVHKGEATSFSETDLKCLSMEELQALQVRRSGHEQLQSVVKVSIQAERSKKRLQPRDYQLELYERARNENTIAVLGTGTGKTLIACLLIKDVLAHERENRKSGKVEAVAREILINRRKFVFSWFPSYILYSSKVM